MNISLRDRLASGQVALGFGVMFPAPGIIECMGAGWDWAWIEGQHGQQAYDSLLGCVRAAEIRDLSAVVRVPGHEYGIIGPVMDMRAAGLMVPMVDTAEQARQIVQAARFPPLGARSYGGRRVVDLDGREYCYTANHDTILIAQIETPEAVANAEAIAAVEGVDALFLGPDDIKLRLGIPINTALTDSDELMRAFKKTVQAAQNTGKHAGTVAPGPGAMQRCATMGCRLLVGGGDVGFLRSTSARTLLELRGALAAQP